MRKVIIIILLVCGLNIHAADIRITPDSSLADAIRHARELRRLGQATDVTIHLASGTYFLYEPLRLRPEDSGLTIAGNNAVISGGLKITNWKKQGKLMVADVPDFNGRPIDFRQLWINGSKAVRARSVPVVFADGNDPFEQMPRIRTYDKKSHVLWVPKTAVSKIVNAPYAEMVLHECGAPVISVSRILVFTAIQSP